MNQFVVIFVPYGEKFADVDVGQHQRPESKNDFAKSADASFSQPEDAEQLPLWRWFTFEKGP